MKPSMNKVILIGYLERDAETAYTASHPAVTTFSVVTTNGKDEQTGEQVGDPNWIKVVLYRREDLARYLTKGKQVYVEGPLQTDDYGTVVVAEDVILLGGPGDSGAEDDNSPESMRSRMAAVTASAAAPMNKGTTDEYWPL